MKVYSIYRVHVSSSTKYFTYRSYQLDKKIPISDRNLALCNSFSLLAKKLSYFYSQVTCI